MATEVADTTVFVNAVETGGLDAVLRQYLESRQTMLSIVVAAELAPKSRTSRGADVLQWFVDAMKSEKRLLSQTTTIGSS